MPQEEIRSFAVDGQTSDDYVGVSPEYKTFADDRQKPFPDGASAQENISVKKSRSRTTTK